MMVLFLMRAHDMSFEEALMGESLVTNLTNNVLYSLKTDDVRLRDVHFERTFLGKYFAALLAHESNVVSHEIVFVQLQFESEGALTNAAFERSITSVVSRDVMIALYFVVFFSFHLEIFPFIVCRIDMIVFYNAVYCFGCVRRRVFVHTITF